MTLSFSTLGSHGALGATCSSPSRPFQAAHLCSRTRFTKPIQAGLGIKLRPLARWTSTLCRTAQNNREKCPSSQRCKRCKSMVGRNACGYTKSLQNICRDGDGHHQPLSLRRSCILMSFQLKFNSAPKRKTGRAAVGVTRLAECLSSMQEGLGSIPSTAYLNHAW